MSPLDLADPRLRTRALVLMLIGFWCLFVGLYTVRSALLGADDLLGAMPRRMAVATVGAAIAWGLAVLIRSLGRRGVRRRILIVLGMSLPAGAAFSAANAFAYAWFTASGIEACPAVAACSPSPSRAVIIDYALSWTFIFIAWGILCLWLETVVEALDAERRAAQSREAARIAEIRALRYQVNPHFLFNCLNSISTLIGRRSPREARAMVGELAAFIRLSLASEAAEDAPLEEEFAMQQRYLVLEERRFGDRLTSVVDLDPEVAHVRVPTLILQPIIENAIKHGVARSLTPVRLELTAGRSSGGGVRIRIADDARPTSGTRLPSGQDGLGIGLRNIAERLALRYGEAAALSAGAGSAGGFIVEIDLPATPVRI